MKKLPFQNLRTFHNDYNKKIRRSKFKNFSIVTLFLKIIIIIFLIKHLIIMFQLKFNNHVSFLKTSLVTIK
jgi:hypothetical protein